MSSYELFSKRNNDYQPDFLYYDFLPTKLRNQIYFIWKDALGLEQAKFTGTREITSPFEYMRDTICREHGLNRLFSSNYEGPLDCEMYLKQGEDYEIVLDLIELSTRVIGILHKQIGSQHLGSYGITMSSEDATKELNLRFRENGVGYEFTDGILIRKDSQILHEEATKPALHLLQEQAFTGALEEFLQAHEHYRKGNYKDSILNAGKSFESTLKTIAHKESWVLTGKESAANLIALLTQHQVIPVYMQTTLLGLPTLRNNVSGHGQGPAPVAVSDYLVNYALHLCGTNIVMLIEAYKEYSK